MSDPSFYFLLKTENVQPLIETVNEFSDQIKLNQVTINSISNQIDSEFKYPNTAGDTTDGTDTIRYLILQKYKLDDIPAETKDHVFHENPRINQLIKDNFSLANLKKQSVFKNQQLLKIIFDYESLIIEQILPSLRNDLNSYKNPNYVDLKFNAVNEIYTRYSMNIEYLTKLIELFSGLFQFLNQYDRSFDQLLDQFEVLTNLHNNLIRLKLPVNKEVRDSSIRSSAESVLNT